MPWIWFRVPTPTPDGRTGKELYERRVNWISAEMREDARRFGCRFRRASCAADGSAFYALAFWRSREGGRECYQKWNVQNEPGEVAIALDGDTGLVPLP